MNYFKKRTYILFIVSLFLLGTCSSSFFATSSSTTNTENHPYSVSGNDITSSLEYSYFFDEPTITLTQYKRDEIIDVTIPNTLSESFKNSLQLPIKNLIILLPYHYEYTNITHSRTEQIIENTLLTTPQTYDISRKRSDISSSFPSIPTEPVTIIGTGALQGYSLLFIRLNPIYYHEEYESFMYTSTIDLTINTEYNPPERDLFRGILTNTHGILDQIENPEILDSYHKSSVDATTSSDSAENYSYIIITSTELEDYFSRFVSYKNNYISTRVVNLSYISLNFYGQDIQERIRECIIYAYQNWGTEYVLLGGDIDIIPHRGLSCQAIDHSGRFLVDHQIPGDLYYAGLDGTWDADCDGRYGENMRNSTEEEADFLAEVYVGRAPVENKAEIDTFTDKVISFETSTRPKSIQLHQSGVNAVNDPDSTVIPEQIAQWIPSDYTIEKLYQSNEEVTIDDWKQSFEQDKLIVQHTGNGEIDYYYIDYPRHSFSTYQSFTLVHDFYPIHTSLSCHSGAFDYEDCLAETLLLNPYGGASACIFNSRWGFTDAEDIHKYSGEIIEQQFYKLFQKDVVHLGKMHQFAKEYFVINALFDPGYRWCYYTLNLLGDPETPVFEKRSSDFTQNYLYVDDDFNQTYPGWGVTHFNSIQQAIDAASEWDTIYVHSGIYNERLSIKKTVHLIGEGKESTIIDGSRGRGTITISASRVTLQGFTITNDGSLLENSRIDVSNSKYVKISDCVIKHNTIGIYASGSNNLIIHNNTFKDNDKAIYATVSCGTMFIVGNAFSLQEQNSYALYLQANGKYYIHNNTIQSHNDFTNFSCGMYLDGTSVVRSNTISTCHIGIWATSGMHTIASNTIKNNQQIGIYIFHSSTIIEDNIIQHNGNNFITYEFPMKPGGIIIDASINNDCRIANNSINNNRGWGIRLEGLFGGNNEITGNDFISNSRQAFFINTRCFWSSNYWERNTPFPKIIFGFYRFNNLIIPMIQIDFHPSQRNHM